MNTNKLVKFYPTLTAVERLRLIHNAGQRGDAREQQRLLDAAPRQHFSRADTGELEIRLMITATMQHAFQLATAAEFWHSQTRAAWAKDGHQDAHPLADAVEFWTYSVIVLERSYVIERDGWNLFLQQSGFDESRISVPQLAQHWMLTYMNDHAKYHPDPLVMDALNWLLDYADNQRIKPAEPPILITPESVANGWQREIEAAVGDFAVGSEVPPKPGKSR